MLLKVAIKKLNFLGLNITIPYKKSIINQLNDDYEVLVIDDGSDDNSLQILSQIKNKFSNYWFDIIICF